MVTATGCIGCGISKYCSFKFIDFRLVEQVRVQLISNLNPSIIAVRTGSLLNPCSKILSQQFQQSLDEYKKLNQQSSLKLLSHGFVKKLPLCDLDGFHLQAD